MERKRNQKDMVKEAGALIDRNHGGEGYSFSLLKNGIACMPPPKLKTRNGNEE
jgi:hypothetical protein